ncbi:AraC family transcriptional regulator [Sphingobacterium sp. JB170]|uniref:AraC family transcriptional regulator n=1 Tax=Sphingobacterium sp. JB170 TaxID=1434842 RepID=UPI00097E8EDD|nr:AraC family transcriptional regulator [Sphingobacterium sp. JB170]SJN47905.1 hypothetical protein FM107_16425 [Sphingobacterium sp. JB170]
MKKTIYLPRLPYLKNKVAQNQLRTLRTALPMANGQRTNLKFGISECVIQEFDSRYVYLYSFEVFLPDRQTFLVRSACSDLHNIYMLKGTSALSITASGSEEALLSLAPDRSRFFYLPQGNYRINLPKGETRLFGYYFDNKIFRMDNERKFDFIKPVIDARRTRSAEPIASKMIAIDPITSLNIRHICNILKHENVKDEGDIIVATTVLLNLARENFNKKCNEVQSQLSLAQNARRLIEDHVLQHGHNFNFEAIYALLGYKKSAVHFAHQRAFQESMHDYKNRLVLEKALKLLEQGQSIKNCAYSCGYNSPETFHRFIKNQLGITPAEYVNIFRIKTGF